MFPTNLNPGGDDDLVDDGPALTAQVTTTDDGRTRCTIHPESATDEEVTTRWISADEGSFVELEAVH